MLTDKEEIFSAYGAVIAKLCDTRTLNAEQIHLEEELTSIYDRMNRMIQKNARSAQEQDDYNRRYDELTAQYEAINEKLKRVKGKITEKIGRKRVLDAFIERLNGLESFDEGMFASTVDKVVVYGDSKGGEDNRTGSPVSRKPKCRKAKKLAFIF